VSRPLCVQQGCQYYRGFIGKSRVQAPLYTARVSILQGLCREKSCPGPFVYSKGVNITGFYKESRDPALYYNGFARLKASKCERCVLSAIQTPTGALRAQKDPQNTHSETIWDRFRAAPWIPRISLRAPLRPSKPRTLMLNHSAAFSRKLPRLQASRLSFF